MEPTTHLMFGMLERTHPGNAAGFERFRGGIEALFSTCAKALGGGAARIGLTGQGCLAGAAREGDSCLVLLGAVHQPLPGWGAGSPLDDPDMTAAFLLRRYRERGLEFLDGTTGAFVVALWDADEKRFILANDPGGMRTTYYTETPAGMAFSSTLYALNCAMDDGLEIDRSLEDFLLGYEFLPWQQTLYKNVYSLAPGMILEWRGGVVRQHASRKPSVSAWRLENLAGSDATEEQAGEILGELFMRCLEEVLPTDKKVAVLLGGFDSALIAAACRKLGKQVDTYTFRFPEPRYNQAFAEQVAKLCDATHHWIDINPRVLQDGLAEYPRLFNQPSGMPHYLVQTAHVLRRMRKDGHHHCLTGDGCDEIFLGYPTVYRRARFFQRYRSVPGWITAAGAWILRQRMVETLLGHPARFVRNILAIAARPMSRRGHISNRILDRHSLQHLRKDFPHQAMDTESILAALALGLEHLSPLRLAYHGKSMPGLNKIKLAGGSSASGLTVLSPYQHPRLVEFARSLPEQMLRPIAADANAATGKRVLMRMAEQKKLLPPEIIDQPKASPVAGMADSWYMGQLKDFLLTRMEYLPFEHDQAFARGLLTYKPIEDLFRKKISLGNYVLNAPAILVTYAAYNDPRRGKPGRL